MASGYVKKASAPATFDLADAFAGLITGDATWSWLIKWVPLLGAIHYDTAAMCDSGPSQTGALSPSDFNTSNRNPLAEIASNVLLAIKLRNAAYDRVFGAFCEMPSTTPDVTCTSQGTFDINDHRGGNQNLFAPQRALPPGTTRVRGRCISSDTGNSNLAWFYWTASSGPIFFGNTNPAVGATIELTLPVANATQYQVNYDNGVIHVGQVELFLCSGGAPTGPTPFTPVQQPRPTGVLDPKTRVYNTIQDLGDELDRQELKLDFHSQQIRYLAAQTAPPATSSGDPKDAADGPVDLHGAIGFVVTVSGVPRGSQEQFGSPARFHHMGRIAIGNATGWLAPIELSVTPQMVIPLPAGVTQCQVTVFPPATATVIALFPPK